MFYEKLNRFLQCVDTSVQLLLTGAIVVLATLLVVALIERHGAPSIASILGVG